MSGYGRWPHRQFAEGRREQRTLRPSSIPTASPIGRTTTERTTTFEQVVDPEHLLKIHFDLKRFGGPAPGIDGFSYEDYSVTEIAAVLRLVCSRIRVGDYLPSPSLIVPFKKDGGKTRDLRLRTIVDRIVSTAVNKIVMQAAERILRPCCFAYRPGLSTWDMLVAIEIAVLHRQCYFFQQDDIRKAFDNVPLALAVNSCQEHVPDARLRHLIEVILRGHDTSRTVGIDQGDPLSPVTLNLSMHSVLDLPLITAVQDGSPLYVRYSDNLGIAGRSALDVTRCFELARQRLGAHGMTLKGEDGGLTYLRRPGSQVRVLGTEISLEGTSLRYRPADPKGLRKGLDEAWQTPNPRTTAREVMRGWVTSQGMCVESVGAEGMVRMVRRAACEAGLLELPSLPEMSGWAINAQARWNGFRSRKLSNQLQLEAASAPSSDLDHLSR
ncbi:reverse transcriptase domain-containing protein [Anatilimnocola floriformis]|uniref:reverse transcriptase domain-containing protein n=1 Tax=Anatilimnocola floriformis TaxID=2948575 RepID=UPI0036F3FC3C